MNASPSAHGAGRLRPALSAWVHRCGCAAAGGRPVRPSRRAPSRGDDLLQTETARVHLIDMHCHVLSPKVEELVAGHPGKLDEARQLVRMLGAESAQYNRTVMTPAAMPKLTNLDLRFADMAAMGVDTQVISPSPTQYHLWADCELAAAIVRTQNEFIAALCKAHPGKLLGLGAVSLQHPELAAEQLRTGVERLGLKGVEIPSLAGGLELSDPQFEPFWRTAEALGALVFIHPSGSSAHDRLDRYYLTNTIGQPFETAVALCHLIFSGTLDRFPALRILAAHGGGFLPGYWARAEHAWRQRSDARQMAEPPRAYLQRLYFDTVLHDSASLRRLIDVVGIGQVVVGTDYPYDMGEHDIRARLLQVPGVSEDEFRAMACDNARRLLQLDTIRTNPNGDSA